MSRLVQLPNGAWAGDGWVVRVRTRINGNDASVWVDHHGMKVSATSHASDEEAEAEATEIVRRIMHVQFGVATLVEQTEELAIDAVDIERVCLAAHYYAVSRPDGKEHDDEVSAIASAVRRVRAWNEARAEDVSHDIDGMLLRESMADEARAADVAARSHFDTDGWGPKV